MRQLLVILWVIFHMPLCFATGFVHLSFHMGTIVAGEAKVGGTVHNKSNVRIEGGYINILTISKDCRPQKIKVANLGAIEPGKKFVFSIPISDVFYGYRLLGFYVFDDMGFSIDTVDDTRKIIAEREVKERETCRTERGE